MATAINATLATGSMPIPPRNRLNLPIPQAHRVRYGHQALAAPTLTRRRCTMSRALDKLLRTIQPTCHDAIRLAELGAERPLTTSERLSLKFSVL